MDTLKGILYLETCAGVENLCLAVEDPKDLSRSIIIKCKGREPRNRDFSRKRGVWKFKAFRFRDNVESLVEVEKPISCLIPDLPDSLYQQIQVNELKKLKEWTD